MNEKNERCNIKPLVKPIMYCQTHKVKIYWFGGKRIDMCHIGNLNRKKGEMNGKKD